MGRGCLISEIGHRYFFWMSMSQMTTTSRTHDLARCRLWDADASSPFSLLFLLALNVTALAPETARTLGVLAVHRHARTFSTNFGRFISFSHPSPPALPRWFQKTERTIGWLFTRSNQSRISHVCYQLPKIPLRSPEPLVAARLRAKTGLVAQHDLLITAHGLYLMFLY